MTLMKPILAGLAVATMAALPAVAQQQFLTAAEVRPMLDATKSRWVELREFNGKDVLSFENVLAWRCGLDGMFYSVNGGGEKRWQEGCYENEVSPNAQKQLPYVELPLGSVQSVTVRLKYDDGSADSASFQRGQILTQ